MSTVTEIPDADRDTVTEEFLNRYRNPVTGKLVLGTKEPDHRAVAKYFEKLEAAQNAFLEKIARVRYVG